MVVIIESGETMGIGNRIENLRERKGWTQRELANRVQLNFSVMNRIESGERPVKDSELASFARVLDTTADYLLGLTDDPTPPKHVQAGIPDDKYQKLSAYQKEVLDFMLNSETLAFHDQPKDLLEALESFEVYYEVWKKHKKKEGEQK